ncbi:MAG TPA: DNA polymerase III subunit delta', partial [Gemmataceae bacterium]|nr:DNA polymerase III subunit delta' [Gemmataceae bacterium]
MSWQQILGHDVQRKAFVHAVQRGRLAHAYLFCGPPGIGKRLFAAELAKALLCENAGANLEACDQCDSCTLVRAGNHPDFFAVARPEDKNEMPIEVMRELCRGFSLKPARGRGKIALLDDADDLNQESSNCFLKTLEEPPPRSVFFLIGTNPERQLATIVSRCQVVRFAPLRDEVVAEILRQQGVTDPALLPRLLRLGRGSPGDALALADADLWAFRKVLLEDLLLPRPDSVALGKKLMEFVEDAGTVTAAQRRRAGQVLRLLIGFFSDALTVSLGGSPRLGDPAEMAMLQKLADRVSPDKLL